MAASRMDGRELAARKCRCAANFRGFTPENPTRGLRPLDPHLSGLPPRTPLLVVQSMKGSATDECNVLIFARTKSDVSAVALAGPGRADRLRPPRTRGAAHSLAVLVVAVEDYG